MGCQRTLSFRICEHWICELYQQHTQKIIIQTGISNNIIIGAYFFTTKFSLITPLFQFLHTYIDEIIEGRWIGGRGKIDSPPRCPKLTPSNHFLLLYINEVYQNRPTNTEYLTKKRSKYLSTNIPAFRNSLNGFTKSWEPAQQQLEGISVILYQRQIAPRRYN